MLKGEEQKFPSGDVLSKLEAAWELRVCMEAEEEIIVMQRGGQGKARLGWER